MNRCESTISVTSVEVNPSSTYQYLSEVSKNDKSWDIQKFYSQRQASLYAEIREFEKYAERIEKCCGTLGFSFVPDQDTGEIKLKLQQAYFCHVRTCNQCESRRSFVNKLKFIERIPSLASEYPKARWLFLTLTHKTCPVVELKDELQKMSKAWGRLIKKTVFKDVIGWTRAVEVTRSKGDETQAHPHYHCLLMVKPGYFGGSNYISQEEWCTAWGDVMRLDYVPVCDVRACRDKKGGKIVSSSDVDSMKSSVAEAIKYTVKTSDLLKEDEFENADWFFEYTRQIKGQKLLTSGGVLKGIFKDTFTDEELIHIEGKNSEEEPTNPEDIAFFSYNKEKRRYRRKLKD
jgi:plasmid rolling circle replication initiator protein Rep